jgi:uncharacterized protein involved in exopolysaccharide biosynthesis
MRNRSIGVLAAIVAILVLVGGVAYTVVRPIDWTSTSELVLVPTPKDPAQIPNTLDGLNASGSVATYVELLASGDLKRRAGAQAVSINVRAIPDSRVISVATVGEKQTVEPALQSVLRAATAAEGGLRDLWSLQTLESPSPPQPSGPSTSLLLLATLLLALLAAVVVVVALRRLDAAQPAAAGAATEPAEPGTPVQALSSSRRR